MISNLVYIASGPINKNLFRFLSSSFIVLFYEFSILPSCIIKVELRYFLNSLIISFFPLQLFSFFFWPSIFFLLIRLLFSNLINALHKSFSVLILSFSLSFFPLRFFFFFWSSIFFSFIRSVIKLMSLIFQLAAAVKAYKEKNVFSDDLTEMKENWQKWKKTDKKENKRV